MSLISCAGDWIALSSGNLVLVFNGISHQKLKLPVLRPPVKENKSAIQDFASEEKQNVVLGLAFSPCCKMLAAYTSGKQLVVWNTQDWTLLSERCMPKVASSMKFTPDSEAIIIVDKAGDAVQFSLKDLLRAGVILLGHLSMLTDVEFAPGGKLIITCDRDEKIRVSNYPNAYNIVSYCLGHKEFVSSISLVPHKPSVLLSSSGDGTLRLWDYNGGKILSTYDCSTDAKQELSADATSLAEMENGKPSSIIIKKARCLPIDGCSSIACVLFYGFQGCLVYFVSDEKIELIQAVQPNQLVVDFFLRSSELITCMAKIGDCNILKCFSYDVGTSQLTSSSVSQERRDWLDKINNSLSTVDQCNLASLSNVHQMFKRKFDNVKEYYEQKKARIGDC